MGRLFGCFSRENGKNRAYSGLVVEALEERLVLDAAPITSPTPGLLDAVDVQTILARAAAASASENAIIAVVDRQGNILGVRVEQGVLNAIPDQNTLIFAIDGAVAEARTAAYFANDQAPITSRTIYSLSQSTITEREVESNPNLGDPASPYQGPGLVAAIGVGGHFPPGVMNTPSADLFGIEQTNRDTLIGGFRFNASGLMINAPSSYGVQTGLLPTAQSRGIGTLPGGIPLFEDGVLVGGIGVFFPGSDGFASHEQGFVAGIGQTKDQRMNTPQELEAEWIAFAAAGGKSAAGFSVGAIGGVPAIIGFDIPPGRIDQAGITLDTIGPHGPIQGLNAMRDTEARVGVGSSTSGMDMQVTANPAVKYMQGTPVPSGWLVAPHDSPTPGGLTQADVIQIITDGVNTAMATRAQIRAIGNPAKMVFAVSDLDGNLLGLYRMPDATYFSIDVAVAKSRNTAYYNNPAALQPADQLPGIAAGVAFTNRTFRYLAQPTFPEAIDGEAPAPFSSLNAPGINPLTGENLGAPLPASTYMQNSTPELLFTSFNAGRNFHAPVSPNQDGVVYFPGSTALYKNGVIVGGFGVSGDGVDQDDFVTFNGAVGYFVPSSIYRSDEVKFDGLRLPYMRFSRNPEAL